MSSSAGGAFGGGALSVTRAPLVDAHEDRLLNPGRADPNAGCVPGATTKWTPRPIKSSVLVLGTASRGVKPSAATSSTPRTTSPTSCGDGRARRRIAGQLLTMGSAYALLRRRLRLLTTRTVAPKPAPTGIPSTQGFSLLGPQGTRRG